MCGYSQIHEAANSLTVLYLVHVHDLLCISGALIRGEDCTRCHGAFDWVGVGHIETCKNSVGIRFLRK